MSDQEIAGAAETPETRVEETPETVTSASTAPAEIAEAPDTPEAASEASTTASDAAEEGSPAAEAATPAPGDEPDSILTLKPRQHLAGKVKNITNFGAFVDIGLAQDGLVHISELAKQKVDKVTDVVSEGQEVDVWIKKVDKKRGRISLTMIKPITRRFRDIKEDDEFEGVVTRLESYGAFVDIDSDREGLVHISQITHDYINHPEEALSLGDRVKVKVLKVNRKKRQVDLSIKALLAPPPPSEPEVVATDEPVLVEETVSEAESEPAPTALALAYAAFQNEQQPSDEKKAASKAKPQPRKEIDAIIARTLAAREN